MTYFCNSVQHSNTIRQAFIDLGSALNSLPEHIIHQANIKNQWFTPEFIQIAAKQWHDALKPEKIELWLASQSSPTHHKSVGIIMAGNIPFVGLHDVLCCLALGFKIKIKPSSNDEVLMQFAIDSLIKSMPELKSRIAINEPLNSIDALIATGSNNSSRYFEYYFKNIPCIIRKSRTSIAVLSGNESEAELLGLSDDIYTYFGLGCRNVSHLLLPRHMALEPLYQAYDKYMNHVHHHKYYNNYMYHKSILLMNLDKHYDNGFMLFQEKPALHAPIATLNYHYYNDLDDINAYIKANQADIQCVVSNMPLEVQCVAFGQTQVTELWDYADNINVLDFLNPILQQ